MRTLGIFLTLLVACNSADAAVAIVNFDDLPTGPSRFVAVPGPQTITAGPGTFTGGVVLSHPTFFPAMSIASNPNLYGTADFGNGLSPSLGITIDGSVTISQVSFLLLNGMPGLMTYKIDAYSGAEIVATEVANDIAANVSSGYALVTISAPKITSLVISGSDARNKWDFFIDDVSFTTAVPDAPTWGLMLIGFLALATRYRAAEKLRTSQTLNQARSAQESDRPAFHN